MLHGKESHEIIAEVLQCTQYGGKFLATANALICSRCGDRVPIEDGVIDFVRGSARTLLDDIDYDDFYRVTKQTSFAQISSLIDQARNWWPSSLGSPGEQFRMSLDNGKSARLLYLTYCSRQPPCPRQIKAYFVGLLHFALNPLAKIVHDAR
jgi:hypothetical protein